MPFARTPLRPNVLFTALRRPRHLKPFFSSKSNEQSIRLWSSASSDAPKNGIRNFHIFGGLVLLGVGATAWGLYDFYSAFTLWPVELRADLRAGIRAKHRGDFNMSSKFLFRAWQTANTLPLDKFTTEPYLKITGIAIVLAEVLEKAGMVQEAYQIYIEVMDLLERAHASSPTAVTMVELLAKAQLPDADPPRTAPPPKKPVPPVQGYSLTAEEDLRTALITYRLGEMAEKYSLPPDVQEEWWSKSVTTILRLLAVDALQKRAKRETSKIEDADVRDLTLPEWAYSNDVSAPLISLGVLHARRGNLEYAMHLYHAAYALITKTLPASSERECRKMEVTNDIVDVLVSEYTTGRAKISNLERAKDLSVGAVKTMKGCIKDDKLASSSEVCARVIPSTLFNLGMIYELQGKDELAETHYRQAKQWSVKVKLQEGVQEAEIALRRIRRKGEPPKIP